MPKRKFDALGDASSTPPTSESDECSNESGATDSSVDVPSAEMSQSEGEGHSVLIVSFCSYIFIKVRSGDMSVRR